MFISKKEAFSIEPIKYGIFSDIHSNMEALMAVLQDMLEEGVTHPICLGDIVGYNANPVECLQLVKALKCPIVRGNHDTIVAGLDDIENLTSIAKRGIAYSIKCLNQKDKDFLGSLPLYLRLKNMMFVHASLDDPEHWNYIESSLEAESSFIYQHTPLCFCGHTHKPVIYEKSRRVKELKLSSKIKLKMDKKYLINVGSVGQPRDGNWRACYVTYVPGLEEIRFRRVKYPVKTVQDKILQAGLPKFLATRLS